MNKSSSGIFSWLAPNCGKCRDEIYSIVNDLKKRICGIENRKSESTLSNSEPDDDKTFVESQVERNYDAKYDFNFKNLLKILRRFVFRYQDCHIYSVTVSYQIKIEKIKKYRIKIRLTPLPVYEMKVNGGVRFYTYYVRFYVSRDETPDNDLEVSFDHSARRDSYPDGSFTYGRYYLCNHDFSFNMNEYYDYLNKILHDKDDFEKILEELSHLVL